MSSFSSPAVRHAPGCTRTGSPQEGSRLRKRRRTDSNRHTTQELGLMRDGAENGFPRFVGSGSGIYFIRAVYQKLAKSSSFQKQALQENLVPGEDDQILAEQDYEKNINVGGLTDPSSIQFWQPHELLSGHQVDDDRAPFESLVEWTKSYFKNWHPVFPFLNAPAVLRIFEDISIHGIDKVSAPDAVIARSILSISLADSRESKHEFPPVSSRLVFTNNASAISSIDFVLAQPASISNLQSAIALQLFFTSMLKFNVSSRLGGVIVRMAFHLGLHRCPSRFPNFSAVEAQTRRRLFWSMYCLERILCQSLGLPLDIRDDDIDVCYPGEEIHAEIHRTEGEELHGRLYFMISLCDITNQSC